MIMNTSVIILYISAMYILTDLPCISVIMAFPTSYVTGTLFNVHYHLLNGPWGTSKLFNSYDYMSKN